ncbi:MAG TPA: acyl carrier protein [Lachnospiraceae bacterium]|nr:acyl carrier protein [uncultured Lachnoclostridium sp.]HAU86886.1 acyl carrier protein [Lachnospiraceae bacterium]
MGVVSEIKQIICSHSTLDIDEAAINREMDLVEHLGINSIGMILIIMDLEQKYDISIDDDSVDFNSLSKVGNLIDVVAKMIGEKSPA